MLLYVAQHLVSEIELCSLLCLQVSQLLRGRLTLCIGQKSYRLIAEARRAAAPAGLQPRAPPVVTKTLDKVIRVRALHARFQVGPQPWIPDQGDNCLKPGPASCLILQLCRQ